MKSIIFVVAKKNFDMTVKRFGVSLEEDLLESLDSYVLTNGFSNRSQAIRFLIEKINY